MLLDVVGDGLEIEIEIETDTDCDVPILPGRSARDSEYHVILPEIGIVNQG